MYAYHQATFHHLPNPNLFVATLACESHNFTYNGQSYIIRADGTRENSWGIPQFFNPERDWGMTKTQALDPWFAIAKAAEAWEDGKMYRWSCTRIVLATYQQVKGS